MKEYVVHWRIFEICSSAVHDMLSHNKHSLINSDSCHHAECISCKITEIWKPIPLYNKLLDFGYINGCWSLNRGRILKFETIADPDLKLVCKCDSSHLWTVVALEVFNTAIVVFGHTQGMQTNSDKEQSVVVARYFITEIAILQWFIHAFLWLKSGNNTNAARVKSTSKRRNYMHADENIKISKLQV